MRLQKSLLAILLLTAVASLISACASPTPTATESAQPTAAMTEAPTAVPPTPAPAAGSVSLTGAGATFPAPLYTRWFYDYAFVDNSVKFNYQAIGSGGGIKAITDKTVDFAGSDAILNDDQKKAAPGVLMFPTVAGAVTVSYNIKDNAATPAPISGLKLDGATVANIFLGKITKW